MYGQCYKGSPNISICVASMHTHDTHTHDTHYIHINSISYLQTKKQCTKDWCKKKGRRVKLPTISPKWDTLVSP
jgi:hypothetical protein